MSCPYQNTCGGCSLRCLEPETYYETKTKALQNILARIQQNNVICRPLIHIPDGKRRRAELTFTYKKGKLLFGFHAEKTHDIVDIFSCPALEPSLNVLLSDVRKFLIELCQIKTSKKIKNKIITNNIQNGDIFLTAAENGTDILIETDTQVIRVALKRQQTKNTEIILEKASPFISIASYPIRIPCGTFLQASKEGETALIKTVLQYVGDFQGNIVDLFCGLGTFSYPLAENVKNKIAAFDSSGESLEYFQKNINALTIHNITINQRNLFKYPLDTTELKNTDVLIFDPPRAGASTQVQKIVAMNFKDKPQKIVAVSCNPHTFINDANRLISGDYKLKEITPVDQFVYTNHLELVALFEKN